MLFDAADGAARRLARPQRREHRVDNVGQRSRFLVAAARPLLHRDRTPFEAVEIGQHQLGFDGFDIADRVDRTLDMHDIAVIETAHDMGDRIDLADVPEKLVAKPFTARRAAHQPGDVDKFELGRDDFC